MKDEHEQVRVLYAKETSRQVPKSSPWENFVLSQEDCDRVSKVLERQLSSLLDLKVEIMGDEFVPNTIFVAKRRVRLSWGTGRGGTE